MAFLSYDKLRENELDNIVSTRDKQQDMHINQLKLKLNETYKKDEKISTNFEAVNDEDVIKKGYLDEKVKKVDGNVSNLEKDYNDMKLQYNKRSIVEI